MSDEVVLWRIAADTPTYEAHDLSGKGAEMSGGRWNRRGTALVYASDSRALACLETVVHLTRTPLPLNRYLVEIRVPRASWDGAAQFDADKAVGWDAEPAAKVHSTGALRGLNKAAASLQRCLRSLSKKNSMFSSTPDILICAW